MKTGPRVSKAVGFLKLQRDPQSRLVFLGENTSVGTRTFRLVSKTLGWERLQLRAVMGDGAEARMCPPKAGPRDRRHLWPQEV